MSDTHTLGFWLRRFLGEHLITERNLAHNTRKSYRDTFVQLLKFARDRLRKPAERLTLDDVSAEFVRQFLTGLEAGGCSVKTRNQRLAAIRAFARFVAAREPVHLDWSAQMRAIPQKKTLHKSIDWLGRNEMKALLNSPDRTTPFGQVEYAVLQFLYNTGARVSEAVALTVADFQCASGGDRPATATLHGKGGKRRQCPLWPSTEKVLTELVKDRPPEEPVFLNRNCKPYTRHGLSGLVKRGAARAPSLTDKTVTPHVLRHTCACHLLQSGVDINTIRAWLGHVSLNTTHIYAEIDLQMKAEAMAKCEMAESESQRLWTGDQGVMAFLAAL